MKNGKCGKGWEEGNGKCRRKPRVRDIARGVGRTILTGARTGLRAATGLAAARLGSYAIARTLAKSVELKDKAEQRLKQIKNKAQ